MNPVMGAIQDVGQLMNGARKILGGTTLSASMASTGLLLGVTMVGIGATILGVTGTIGGFAVGGVNALTANAAFVNNAAQSVLNVSDTLINYGANGALMAAIVAVPFQITNVIGGLVAGKTDHMLLNKDLPLKTAFKDGVDAIKEGASDIKEVFTSKSVASVTDRIGKMRANAFSNDKNNDLGMKM
jgi:hypothetical protein